VNYDEALSWLHGKQNFGVKLGLGTTHRLLEAVGRPEQGLRFIHVAGTNGKGSTCAMLDSVLRRAGVHSGLYTSPHLLDFRERIRADGAMIPREDAAEGLTLLRDASEGWEQPPTFFELATVLAAWWFARRRVEVVVWETGMGGRLDATNAVTPIVSVITPIRLDHKEWLGPTIADIAREKAGIIKPGIPVVAAPQDLAAQVALEARARETGSVLRFVSAPYGSELGLPGPHQRWNAAVVIAALDAAGLARDPGARRDGLRDVQWPARFQRLDGSLVVDGAHNEHAMSALVDAWRAAFGEARAQLVFGAMRDKDCHRLLAILRAIADEVWLVPVRSPRAAAVEHLLPLAREEGFRVIRHGAVADVLGEVRASGAPALVTGSLFLAAEVLALESGEAPPAPSAQ
jgi:dihydrofolate synthase/folylpolyglutamate synthase